MKWNKLTVAHYQALYPIMTDREIHEIDRDIKVISVVNGLTEAEIDASTLKDLRKMINGIQFLYSPIPGKAVKYIKGKKHRYKINYNIEQIPFARYAEVKTFKGEGEADFIFNMHKLMASMVVPVNIFRVKKKYNPEKHAEYANDLLDARFIDVYHSCVFFYHLFTALTASTKDYLVRGIMMTKNLNREEAEKEHQTLCDDLAGFITQNKLPSLKESALRRLGISQLFKPSTTSVT